MEHVLDALRVGVNRTHPVGRGILHPEGTLLFRSQSLLEIFDLGVECLVGLLEVMGAILSSAEPALDLCVADVLRLHQLLRPGFVLALQRSQLSCVFGVGVPDLPRVAVERAVGVRQHLAHSRRVGAQRRFVRHVYSTLVISHSK